MDFEMTGMCRQIKLRKIEELIVRCVAGRVITAASANALLEELR